MIKITFSKNQIKVSGHANFNDYGYDIVCASVSSIIYTTINGILSINAKAIEYTDQNDLIINILSHDDITDKLINSMLELLNDLAKQYPKNIIVKES